MLILGIESSCDETAVAIVEDGRRVLTSLVASQIAAHTPFGGVVPEVAAREHLRVIGPLLKEALHTAGVRRDELTAVAVTQGPGLIGALLVGVAFAKGAALALGRPLVPVDHVHAHVHGALLGLDVAPETLYPTLALVVSGGHTNLYRMLGPTHFKLLASSIDDACGECFDKVAKVLGLGYPGGPEIERLAVSGRPDSVAMPRMVEEKARLEFSYSGLKTFMANYINRQAQLAQATTRAAGPTGANHAPAPAAAVAGAAASVSTADLCASFQEEALGQIVRKLREAYRLYPDSRSVLVAGGVAANSRFRALMADGLKIPAYFPHPKHCSDNAAMIAAYGYHVFQDQLAAGTDSSPQGWDAYSRYDYARARLAP